MIKTIGLLLLLPVTASAADAVAPAPCGQAVAALADRLGISLEPEVAPGAGSDPERLAQNQGVVRPPDTGSQDVVHSPPVHDAMPTTPDVPPQAGSGSSSTPAEHGGATRIRLQSLLTAAEAADRQADETQCRTDLAAAERLARAP